MLAYLDPSAIDAAIRAHLTAGSFRRALASLGFEPVASHMGLHEIARPLVTGQPQVAIDQFRFLRDIKPSWHQPAPELFRQEVAFFRTRDPIAPSLDQANLAVTLAELHDLCQGRISSELRAMIVDRSEAKRTDWRASTEQYIEGIRKLRRSDASQAPAFKTFEEVSAFFPHHKFLLALTPDGLSRSEAMTLARQLDTYPALRAHVNYWLYLCFIVLSAGVVPAHDRLDDFRHVIEASYCHAVLTNDRGFLRVLPYLAPHLVPLPWETVAAAA